MGLPTPNADGTPNATTTNGDHVHDPSSSSTAPSSSHPPPATDPSQQQQQQPPSDPSQLPTAALDLAAKLFDLAREGNTATLQQYVAAGIPPNLTNRTGDTLLMLAAYHGHAETVKMLLERGSDPNVKNDRGQSPIAGAVFKGWDEVVRALFEGGADIHAGQPNAVDCARMFRRDEILTLFGAPLGEGTTIDVNNTSGQTA